MVRVVRTRSESMALPSNFDRQISSVSRFLRMSLDGHGVTGARGPLILVDLDPN